MSPAASILETTHLTPPYLPTARVARNWAFKREPRDRERMQGPPAGDRNATLMLPDDAVSTYTYLGNHGAPPWHHHHCQGRRLGWDCILVGKPTVVDDAHPRVPMRYAQVTSGWWLIQLSSASLHPGAQVSFTVTVPFRNMSILVPHPPVHPTGRVSQNMQSWCDIWCPRFRRCILLYMALLIHPNLRWGRSPESRAVRIRVSIYI